MFTLTRCGGSGTSSEHQSPNRKIRLQTSRLVSSPNISSRLVSRDVLQEKSFWYRKVNVSKRRN